jgi:hypothetical protein
MWLGRGDGAGVGILAQRGGAGVTLGRGGGERLLIISHINIVRSHLEHVCLNTTVFMFKIINFKLFLYRFELSCSNFNFKVVCVKPAPIGRQPTRCMSGALRTYFSCFSFLAWLYGTRICFIGRDMWVRDFGSELSPSWAGAGKMFY